MQTVLQREKKMNLGTKMPYLGILGMEFGKIIIMFEIGTLKFVYIQSLIQKERTLNS